MSELVQRQAPQMTLHEKLTYAEKLAASGLIPQAYQRNPPNVLVAVEKGEALGLHPMVALEEINVIHGRTSMSATLMMSLTRAAGHIIRTRGDAQSATCTILRKDDPEFEHIVTWDQAKAQQNQLWGKGHWAKNPELMLKYRAISECVRMACPEVLAGVKYTPEEVLEFVGEKQEAQPQRDPQQQQEPQQAEQSDPIADRIDGVLQSQSTAQVSAFGKWLTNNHPDHPRLSEVREHYDVLVAQESPEAPTEPVQEPLDGEIIEEPES